MIQIEIGGSLEKAIAAAITSGEFQSPEDRIGASWLRAVRGKETFGVAVRKL